MSTPSRWYNRDPAMILEEEEVRELRETRGCEVCAHQRTFLGRPLCSKGKKPKGNRCRLWALHTDHGG